VQTIEILKTYRPANVTLGDCHLAAAERDHFAVLSVEFENDTQRAETRGRTVMGVEADAFDLCATICSAGEALCKFILGRSLIHPFELALAKHAIASCKVASHFFLHGDMLALSAKEKAENFVAIAPTFIPIFDDLEAHAVKKFPHLAGANNGGEQTNAV
jgi:hypothetical protein